MYAASTNRPLSAAAALGIAVLIGSAMVLSLRAGSALPEIAALLSVDLTPDPPKPAPPPPPPREPRKAAAKGEPAPPARKNEAAQIVVPPQPPPLKPPPPVPTAPVAGTGSAANQGAALVDGPGQGAGGVGNGFGGGGTGGFGDGDGGGLPSVGPRQIKGKMSEADLPDGLLAPGSEASVGVRYTVNADGSVSNCIAERPSGYPSIDAMACRLIIQRFRFRPARDREGRPVRAIIVETHTWVEERTQTTIGEWERKRGGQ